MRYPIDLVFVNTAWEVVAIRHSMPPWRFTPIVWPARCVVELPEGMAQRVQVKKGDRLELLSPHGSEHLPGC
jgi:uncharacterized membrane protein (UPF0127 family)